MKAKDHEKVGAILERIELLEAARRTLYYSGTDNPAFECHGMGGKHDDKGESLQAYFTVEGRRRVAHAIEMELYGTAAMLREELNEIGVYDVTVADLRQNPELAVAKAA